MKKRADGRYQKNAYIGIGEDGKKKYKSVFGQTQKEVNQKVAELKIKLNKGIDVTSENDTFGDWVNRWKIYKKDLVSENQFKNYNSYLKHFESLFHIPLTKLQVTDFQMIINKLAKHNPTTGKPTSKKTLRELKITVNQIFEFAIRNRAVDFNPISYIEIPNSAPKKERRALSREEQNWIINTPGRAQLPAMIMMLAGLRLGECLALQWCDIDLDNATIDVHKTVKMVGNHSEIKQGTKTEAGIRIVDMPKILVDFLKSQPNKSPFDLVVSNTHKGLITKSSWKNMWNSYLKDLNLKYGDFSAYVNKPKSKFQPQGVPFVIEQFTAHYLRHTHATNLFKAGYDVLYIQNQLGHTKPETTLNIYTHLVKDVKKEPQSKLDKYLAV